MYVWANPTGVGMYHICTNTSFIHPLASNTPESNLGYLAPCRTVFHGCQIVHWDPLNAKRGCVGYVKLHGLHDKLLWV